MDKIFLHQAQTYYTAGLPVVPLFRTDNQPSVSGWGMYYDRLPLKTEQSNMMGQYSSHNIGLVVGPQAGVSFLQVHFEDSELLKRLKELVPEPVWTMRDDDSEYWLYEYNEKIPNFEVYDIENRCFFRYFSARKAVPLPPSVQANGTNEMVAQGFLPEFVQKVTCLEDEVEQHLREMVEHYHVEVLHRSRFELSHNGWSVIAKHTPAGVKDVGLRKLTGEMVSEVLGGIRTFMEAVDNLRGKSFEFEHVVGTDSLFDTHVRNLVNWIETDSRNKNISLPEGWDRGLTPAMKKRWGVTLDEDSVSWSYDRAVTWISENLLPHIDDPNAFMAGVEQCMLYLARAHSMSSIDVDRVFVFLRDIDNSLSVASLRRRIRELRSTTSDYTDQTQVANAYLQDLTRMYELCYHQGDVWQWLGSHWAKMPQDLLVSMMSANYGNLKICSRYNDIMSILRLVHMLLPQGLPQSEVQGVNFANGFLTQDLRLVEHSPRLGMTYTMPVRYVPGEEAAEPTQFLKLLEDCWGHSPDYEDKVKALQEAMAATIFGQGTVYQRAVLLHGVSRSGKSQLLDIVSSLVPDEARCSVSPHDWSDKFLRTQMYNKILNIAGELSERRLIEGLSFKQVVDGSETSGQYKNKPIFEFFPRCTQWFGSNHLPKSDDTSAGFTRRWLILDFDKRVETKNIVRNLGKHIVATEQEAIISWAVKGMPRLVTRCDYTLPESHKHLIGEVANLNNTVRFFLTEGPEVVRGPIPQESGGTYTPSIYEDQLYRGYQSFCSTVVHAKPVSFRSFKAKVRELAPELGFEISISPLREGSQSIRLHRTQYKNLTLAQHLQGIVSLPTSESSDPSTPLFAVGSSPGNETKESG